jgi:hypothetical protein
MPQLAKMAMTVYRDESFHAEILSTNDGGLRNVRASDRMQHS